MLHSDPTCLQPETARVVGIEVLRRLKAGPCTLKLPLVVLTSTHEHRDMEECYLMLNQLPRL